MSLDRYLKDEAGFRRYVELMESTPTGKRQQIMATAKQENPLFVETAEKHILTFERILQLPALELTEVLGEKTLKAEALAVAILSITDPSQRQRVVDGIPRNISAAILLEMKDRPPPQAPEIGSARLQLIKKARELESRGKLKSVQLPKFAVGHFANGGLKAA